jgi:hypothetical protein
MEQQKKGGTAISKFDKDIIQSLRPELDDAVDTFSKKYGINLSFGKCTYTPNNATMTLAMSVKTADGTAITREREDYERLATLYNLKPEWLDKTFPYKGQTYRIVGLANRRIKNPVLCEVVGDGGEPYLFSAELIESVFDPDQHTQRKCREARECWNANINGKPRPYFFNDVEPEWLGRVFDVSGEAYKVEGATLSDKFPIVATRVRDGKIVQFAAQGLKHWMSKEEVKA